MTNIIDTIMRLNMIAMTYDSNVVSSEATEIYSYGDDVYVLTSEYYSDSDDCMTYLWINGKIAKSYPGVRATGFTVL